MTRQHAHVDQCGDAAVHHMLIARMSLMRGRTQHMSLSAPAVQVSACHVHVVHTRIVLVHLGRGSVTPMARMPCCIVPGEPVGRAREQPDGAHARLDRAARWRPERATDSALQGRRVLIFVS